MECQNKYFKVISFNNYDNGIRFLYKQGLNTIGRCEPNYGFIFTTIDNIHHFYKDGTYLCEISLPTDDEKLEVHYNVKRKIYTSNKIIIENKYSLMDPQTYQKFDIDITKNKYAILNASAFGNVSFLDWWFKSGVKIPYDPKEVLSYATTNGHLNILEWWKNNNLKLIPDEESISLAELNNHNKILDFWKNNQI